MTVNRKTEASLKSSVDEPHEIAFAGLECDVVSLWNFCSVGNAQKASDVASAVKNDAGVFEPDICCSESAVVALIPVQYVDIVVLELDLPQSVMINGFRG